MAAHPAGGPTGPPGKGQEAKRSSSPLLVSTHRWNAVHSRLLAKKN